MNINIKMNTDFEISLTKLKEEYGEDFEVLNGIHESHTNFSDFIDGFIDKNVADVTTGLCTKGPSSLLNIGNGIFTEPVSNLGAQTTNTT